MTENDLKKLLNQELDNIAPSMSEKVKKAPIVVSAGIKRESLDTTDGIKREPIKAGIKREPSKTKMRKNFTIGSIAAALVIAVVLSIALPIALGGGNTETPSFSISNMGYIQMDINPRFEMIYDNNFKVTKVLSGNQDGDVVLNDQTFYSSLIGKDADVVATMLTKRSGELGFVDVNQDNVVKIISVNDNDTDSNSVLAKVANNIQDSMKEMGIFCVVAKEKKDKSYLEEKYNTAIDNANEALAKIQNTSTNYFERLSSDINVSIDELKKYYEQQLSESLRAQLIAECNRITKTRALLQQAQLLNDEIKALSTLKLLDYWYYKDYPDKITNEIRTAYGKMTLVLADIATSRDGVEITSEIDLNIVAAAYNLIDEQKLLEFGNKTLDELKDCVGIIADMLKDINAKFSEKITCLINSTASNVQEFLQYSQQRVSEMTTLLNETYYAIFNQDRPAISQSTFDQRYDEIVREYGSIENYYESRHNIIN